MWPLDQKTPSISVPRGVHWAIIWDNVRCYWEHMGMTQIQNIQHAPVPPSLKGKKHLVYWCHSSLGRSSFPMAILAIAYIYIYIYLFITYIGQANAKGMFVGTQFHLPFIHQTSTPFFSLHLGGASILMACLFCQCGLDIEICKHPILPHQTSCPKWQMCFQHQSLWLAYVASPLEKGRKATSLISKHIYHFE